jgi:hypothetical protein
MEVGSLLPEAVQDFFNEGSTPALAIIFGGFPFVFVGLVIVAAATSAILLRPFISRSTARNILESVAPPTGLGRVERFLLTLFRGERS